MEYQFIVNPMTNRKCRTDTVLGKRIIKTYLNQQGGGKKMKDYPNTYRFIKIVLEGNPNISRDTKILDNEVNKWERAEQQLSGENRGEPKYSKKEMIRYRIARNKGFKAGETINNFMERWNITNVYDKEKLRRKLCSNLGEDIPIPEDHKDTIMWILDFSY